MDVMKPVSRRTLLAGAAAAGAVVAADSLRPASALASRSAADQVTLQFWTNHDAVTDVPLFNKVIQNFQAAYPTIKVNLTNYPGTNFDSAVIPTRATGGTLADVFYNRTFATADRANRGWTLALDPYMARAHVNTSDFWSAEVAQMTWKGKQYSLPYDWSDWGVFYNKTMFDKKGIKYPPTDGSWTWDDLLAMSNTTTLGFWGWGRLGGGGLLMIAAYAPLVAPPSAQPPTPNLAPRDVERLADDLVAYHARFAPLFQRTEQRRAALLYLQGQLLDLERKTIEPLAHAVVGGDVQALQQFIGQSPWDAEAVLHAHQAYVGETLGDAEEGAFIIDGCDFPKQGTESVGVARQWCGPLGKRANCQSGVVICYASPRGYTLVDRRLYLVKGDLFLTH